MHHAVVECWIQEEVTDHRSAPEHVGTDHEADYDSHKPAKSGFFGETGTETQQDFSINVNIDISHLPTLCYFYGKDDISACVYWFKV